MKRTAKLDHLARLSIHIDEVSSQDDTVAHEAIDRLARLGARPATLAQQIRNAWGQRYFDSGTIDRISKWCFTAGAYAAVQPTARKVARLLFGTDLPRLVDGDNGEFANYLQLVTELIPEINAAEGLIEEDWDAVVSGGGYRDQMLRRFWEYACSSYSKLEAYFDQPEVSESRPPVFLPIIIERVRTSCPDHRGAALPSLRSSFQQRSVTAGFAA